MNKLGIVGGMGPLATSIFFKKIIEHTKARCDQDHIWTIISSHSTMPDRTNVILNNLDKQVIIDEFKKDVEIMEAAKVSLISIPCNTFHYFYDDVDKLTDIKILNMIDLTLSEFSKRYGKNPIILSTKGTKSAKVYEKYAEKYNIEIINIDEKYSEMVNDIIYKIKSTNKTDKEGFEKLISELQKEYTPDGFVLACTELSVIDTSDIKENVLDAMDVLVKNSIENVGYEYI